MIAIAESRMVSYGMYNTALKPTRLYTTWTIATEKLGYIYLYMNPCRQKWQTFFFIFLQRETKTHKKYFIIYIFPLICGMKRYFRLHYWKELFVFIKNNWTTFVHSGSYSSTDNRVYVWNDKTHRSIIYCLV